MAPKSYDIPQNLVPLDATFEFRRAKASLGNKSDGVDWLKCLEGKGAMDEVYKAMLSSILTVDERRGPREVTNETDDVVEPRRRPVDDHGKSQISEDNMALVPFVQSQSDSVARARSDKIGMAKEENEANGKAMVVKKENRKTYHGRGSRKHMVRGQTESKKAVRGDNGCSSKKAAFANSAVKEEPDNCVETRMPKKGFNSQIGNVKHAKGSFADESDEKYLEGEGSSKSGQELMILDSDKVAKKEIVSGFVCSKKYHSSMADEGIDSEFRRELLEVLKKPYDKEEYQKSWEAIHARSYLDYYPGQLKIPKGVINVQRKLTKYRYKWGKCVIIVRGFLFWLQNLTREGAFEPWKDEQCLELELPSL